MSYARIGSTGHYIYNDSDDDIYFDMVRIPNDTIDIFLYKISNLESRN